MADDDPFLLETHDGVPVIVHRWVPDGEVRGIVNLVHGMLEHASRYAHVAAALTRIGVAVYAADLRGHGDTAQNDDELGHFADERGWARVLDDLHRITVGARKEHPDVPAFIFGHSMGSFLVQQYLFTFPSDIDGAVLSGSSGPRGAIIEAAAVVARAERLRLGSRGRSALLTKLVFGPWNDPFQPASTDFDWLSSDPEQVARYLDDPRCGFEATTQFYSDLFAGLRVIQQADRVAAIRSDLPIYVFSGSEDPNGGTDGVQKLLRFYEKAGLTAVEHRIYEGGRHEMVNETNRDEVVADLVAWIDRRIAELAPTDR